MARTQQTDSTCWTLIAGAAAGSPAARAEFADRYRRVVEAFFSARWRSRHLDQDLQDAIQEVFFECFKAGGALGRAAPDAPAGFRGYLYGITRNVAARFEQRRQRHPESPALEDEALVDDAEPARAFEREMALAVVEQARERLTARARILGGVALDRVEILRLRFEVGLPIRDIAARLAIDSSATHKQYARARSEFHDALREVVSLHVAGGMEAVDEECAYLLAVLKRPTP